MFIDKTNVESFDGWCLNCDFVFNLVFLVNGF
ncbi:hypothetical protein [Spiroplasma sp. ChiS]